MKNQPQIILVEPAGPLNVGSVARVMKNMGLEALTIVNPQCNYLGEEARRMAVHGIEILETATIVESIPTAIKPCHHVVATVGRERAAGGPPLQTPQQCLPWLIEAPSALIFGPEDRGLSNEELKYAQRFLRIPTSEVYPSLNLAQAVGICCYEMYQLQSQENKTVEQLQITATLEEMEGYYQHLETLLLKIGYLHPHTATSRMEKFRTLYNRASLSKAEVAMLRGICRQMEWAISFDNSAIP